VVIQPVKMLRNQNFCEQDLQLKIMFTNKLRKYLKLGYAWYHAIQNYYSSRLISKNIQKFTGLIFRVVLYWIQTWSVTLKEHRHRVFWNRWWWDYFDLRKRKLQENRKNCLTNCFIIGKNIITVNDFYSAINSKSVSLSFS
jgi:hypothetical protein